MSKPVDLEPERISPSAQPIDDFSTPLSSDVLWATDTGTLTPLCRKTLIQLVRGPMISGRTNPDLWRELVNNQAIIRSRLADLFLELVINPDSQIAFVKNPNSDAANATQLPKTVKSLPLKLLDSVMLLVLRNELLASSNERVIVGRDELYDQLAQYRPLAKLDEAAYKKRIDSSWAKFAKGGILLRTDNPDRCEISPVLSLIFGVDEVRAIEAEYEHMIADASNNNDALDDALHDTPRNALIDALHDAPENSIFEEADL